MASCFPSPSPPQHLCSAHLWPHCFQSSRDLFSEKLSVFLPNLWSDTPPPSHRVHIQCLNNVTLSYQLVNHKGLPIVYMFERMGNSQFSETLVAENQPQWEYTDHGTWNMQSSSCPHFLAFLVCLTNKRELWVRSQPQVCSLSCLLEILAHFYRIQAFLPLKTIAKRLSDSET